MIYDITATAERDIREILTATLKMFGTYQLSVYTNIIEQGLALVAEDPERAGSIDRSSIAPNVRLFHLELAANRRGGAAHCLFYTRGKMSNGEMGVIILRVLHEGMEPRYRLLRTLNQYKRTHHEETEASDDELK